MNFFTPKSTNKTNKKFQKTLIILSILFLFVFLINIFGSQIKNFFYVASSPVQGIFLSAGKLSSDWFGSLINSASLSKENEELKKENCDLLAEISAIKSSQQEAQALKEVQPICEDKSFTVVLVKISGYDNQDMISINRGSEDGVKEGMPVINQQNVLFGKVFKVYKNFSQVMLISNKNSIVNVQVQQQDLEAPIINGSIKGNGGLSVYLDLVPVDAPLNIGQTLITSVLEQTFPKDILIGEISNVIKNDQKPFQQAKVKPFFDINNAENLFVITNYKQE